MDIFANKQTLPFECKGEKTLGDLVTSLVILANDANKIVTEVRVNNEPIALDKRETYQSRPLDETIKRVEISVENKLQIVMFAIQEAKSLLPQFIAQLSEVSEFLMAGQKHKAMSLFSSALELWQRVIHYLRTIGVSYNLNFNTITFDEKTIEQKNKELLAILQEIKNAMEHDDIVSLGDLIEYELISKIEEQKQIIAELEARVQKADVEVNESIKSKIHEQAVSV